MIEALHEQSPSPIQPLAEISGVHLIVKRDDLLNLQADDPFCGNKWRKLKYNLLHASRLGCKQLLTFGGAYSNHIAAVASAGSHFDFKTIGIIRGERHPKLNPTLAFAHSCGMHLHYLDRASFRNKTSPTVIADLRRRYGDFYLIPEGGTNELAIQGCSELIRELELQLPVLPDVICLSCGTGGTLAGVISGLNGRNRAIGFSALKGSFLREAVEAMLPTSFSNWQIDTEYHFGGYAKFTDRLIHFINDFYGKYQFRLDPIYTGKLFFGLFDLINCGFFQPGTTVLAVHTGGLQGLKGFNERFNGLLNF